MKTQTIPVDGRQNIIIIYRYEGRFISKCWVSQFIQKSYKLKINGIKKTSMFKFDKNWKQYGIICTLMKWKIGDYLSQISVFVILLVGKCLPFNQNLIVPFPPYANVWLSMIHSLVNIFAYSIYGRGIPLSLTPTTSISNYRTFWFF